MQVQYLKRYIWSYDDDSVSLNLSAYSSSLQAVDEKEKSSSKGVDHPKSR